MRSYDITDRRLIRADSKHLYQTIIDEIEGKTSWSLPYLRFIAVDQLPFEDAGSIRWLKTPFLGRPRMQLRTEYTIPAETISVQYIDGDFIGNGIFTLRKVGDFTEVAFKWTTVGNSLLFKVIGYIFPVGKAHSCLVKAVLNRLSNFVKKTFMNSQTTPPYMIDTDKVILFDGVCRLCNAWSRFIIKYDTNNTFRLASVQSKEGQAILQHFGMPIDRFDTMLFVDGRTAYEKSTAFLNIVRHLPQPIRALTILRVIPKRLRDWIYDRIALNRYTLFGKYDQCLLPTPDHEKRFL